MYLDRDKYNLILARQCIENSEIWKALHMSQANYNRIVRGGKTTPATLGHIAKYLGVDVTEIMKQ